MLFKWHGNYYYKGTKAQNKQKCQILQFLKNKINTLFPHLSQNIPVINTNMYFSQVKMKTTFELI